MNNLKRRLDRIEKKLNERNSLETVVLIGDSNTDFKELQKQHLKLKGRNSNRIRFINITNSYGQKPQANNPG